MKYIHSASDDAISQEEYIDQCEEFIKDGEALLSQLQRFADSLANFINNEITKYSDSWKYFAEDLLEPEVLEGFSDIDSEDADEYYDAYEDVQDIKEDLEKAGANLETNIDKLRVIVNSLRYL